MTHRHRPDGKDETPDGRCYGTYPFFGCVRPERCNPAAHGNVVYEEQCACGWASRVVADNYGHREVGAWTRNQTLYQEH